MADSGSGYRTAPHTADLRIEAWAPTRDDCIRQAVLAVVESFLVLSSAHANHTRLRRLTADRDDDLLAAVLEELIYLLDTAAEAPVDLRSCKTWMVVSTSHSGGGLAEEKPDAYEDIDEVIEVSHHGGLARKVARLVPLGCVEG
jgi:SHS2 domain-containing protein